MRAKLHRQQGVVAVIVVVAMFSILLVAGLALDASHAMHNKSRLQGVMDAAISQNPGHEARAAVRVLLALARGEPILIEQEKIRIDIVMRDNLP